MTPPQPSSALVVAHPDDEALWLSSVVTSAQRTVFGFGDVFENPARSRARRQAVAALGLPGVVDLKIPESGVAWKSYVARPELTASGVRIAEPAARDRYEHNFARLLDGLRTALNGYRDVYTHNPWGEYGHAEHIQVYRAVSTVQEELGFTVWFANYVGRKNWTFVQSLAGQQHWARRRIVTPDLNAARTLMQTYRQHGAWTWTSAYRWPDHEVMYAQPPRASPEPRHAFLGEWLLDAQTLRRWPPSFHGPWRLLGANETRRARELPL